MAKRKKKILEGPEVPFITIEEKEEVKVEETEASTFRFKELPRPQKLTNIPRR